MKPVQQTVTEPGKGNCLAACVASLLELPIEDIPDLDGRNNWVGLQSFLLTHGLQALWFSLQHGMSGRHPKEALCILIGGSPRSTSLNHAVVARDKYGDFENVWDPHPEGGWLDGEPKYAVYFVAADPGLGATPLKGPDPEIRHSHPRFFVRTETSAAVLPS